MKFSSFEYKNFFFIELTILILTKFLLEYFYISFLCPHYSYSGFSFEMNIYKYLFSWFIYILGYIILYTQRDIKIFEIYLLLFLLYFLPNVVYFGMSSQSLVDLLILVIPFLILVKFNSNKKFISINKSLYGNYILIISTFFILSSVLINYYDKTNGNFVFSFSEVYFFRDKYGLLSNEGIFSYINSWAMKIFSVVLFAGALLRKSLLGVLVSLFVFLLIFFLSGHKSIFQGLFLVIFFYFIFLFENKRLLIIFGFFLFVLVVCILSLYLNQMIFGSLLIRRLLFVPVHLNFTYLEFFSMNEFIYWSNGILRNYIEYPYDVSPSRVIGEYLSKPDMSANTGSFATAFMHGGFLGLIIYTLIMSLILYIINFLILCNKNFFAYSVVFIPIYVMFVSSDLLTSLLTHGLFVAVIVLWLFNYKSINMTWKIF